MTRQTRLKLQWIGAGCNWIAMAAFLAALLSGCTGVPGQIVVSHADTAGANHLARVRAAAEVPPRVIPATPAELETWEDHWQAIRASGESAQ